jgi:hypothetical protein
MANSRRRSDAPARRRLATFAQAMSRTRTIAPNRVRSGPRADPDRCSASGTTAAVMRVIVLGFSAASCVDTARSSCSARSIVGSGFSRATTFQ